MVPRETQSWLLWWWLLFCLSSPLEVYGVVEPGNEEGYAEELYCPQKPVGHCLAKRELCCGGLPKWVTSTADTWVCLPEESDKNPIHKGVQVPVIPWGVKFGEERRQALIDSNYAVKHCGIFQEPPKQAGKPGTSDWLFLAGMLGIGPICLVLAEWQRIYLAKAKKRRQRNAPLPADDGAATTDDITSSSETPAAPPAPPKVKKERVAYYDFWRCVCVGLAVYTHSDETHVRHNTLMTQQWVMPILSIISGRLFARSRATTMFYTSRLIAYFSIGCLFNFLASLSQGDPWWTSAHKYIMFQMPYVLLLAGFGAFSTPLKQQLHKGASGGQAIATMAWYGIAAAMIITLQICLWAFDKVWFLQQSSGLDLVFRVSVETFGGCLLVSLWVFVTFQADRVPKGLVGWMYFACIYFSRIIHAEKRPGSEFHLGELYIWACVVELVPLAGRKEVGKCFLEWWPAWVIGVAMCTIPGFEGRHDQYPWPELFDRFRQYIPEAFAMLGFVTIPEVSIAEGAIGIPQGFKDNMDWASNWSLFTFLIHKAVYSLLPQPWAIVAVVATGIIPYLRNQQYRARKKKAQEEESWERPDSVRDDPTPANEPTSVSGSFDAGLKTNSYIELSPCGGSQRLLV